MVLVRRRKRLVVSLWVLLLPTSCTLRRVRGKRTESVTPIILVSREVKAGGKPTPLRREAKVSPTKQAYTTQMPKARAVMA